MQQISFYLKKFENLGLRDKNIKNAASEAILEVTGVEIKEEEVQLIRDQIKIQKTGPEKAEIFIHKAQIEKVLNQKLGEILNREEVAPNKKVF
jgi:hypothetical protein